MFFDWFNAGEAISFAEEIAKDIDNLLTAPAPGGRPRSIKKGNKQFDSLLAKVQKFSKKSGLNIFKKAKFLNTVKWSLRDWGYDDSLTSEIIVLLTAAINE